MPHYYFAYGSNMSAVQMAQRCPGAVAMGHARLDGWSFVINAIGAAAIRPDSHARCYGVLWRCTARHLADLDRYEGVASGVYTRARKRVMMGALATPLAAVVYIAQDVSRGTAPIPGYVEHAILPGARAFDLPPAYLAELRGWLPGGAHYDDPSVRRRGTYRYGLKKTRKFTGWGGQR